MLEVNGFWFDLDDFPGGPSFTTSITPNRESLVAFEGNIAHSNEMGLKIWHGCKELSCTHLYPPERTVLENFVASK